MAKVYNFCRYHEAVCYMKDVVRQAFIELCEDINDTGVKIPHFLVGEQEFKNNVRTLKDLKKYYLHISKRYK